MSEPRHEGGPDHEFAAHLAQGRFMIQRGVTSGRFVFPPRIATPGSGEALEWVEATGFGTVYSTTVVRRRPPDPSFNVALIDLAEGLRLMSRVEGIAPEAVSIGMAVCAFIAKREEGPLLLFRLLEGGE